MLFNSKEERPPDHNKVIYGGNSNSFFFFNGETMSSILNYKHLSVFSENSEFIMKQVIEATLFFVCVPTL